MNTRFKTLSLALATAMVMGLSACSPAGDTASKSEKGEDKAQVSVDPLNKVQSIVEKTSNGAYRATKMFDVPGAEGMKGVVVEPRSGQQNLLGWTNASGDFFIPGPFFNSEGVDITKDMMHKYGGLAAPKDVADQIQDVGFVAGTKGPIVTAFFEPYCGYCNQLFEKIAPKIDAGELRVRFVMVGFLAEDSLGRAADIVNASNPYAALKTWEGTKDKSKVKPSTASEEQKSKILQNNMTMNKAGQSGTPALVFCDKNGDVQISSGMPQDINGFFSNIGSEGHPSCSQ